MILFTVLTLLCIGFIVWLLYGYYQAKLEYSMVREGYVKREEPKEPEPGEEPEEPKSPFPELDIDIDGLLAKNPDFAAWIYYEDGKLDYPIVKERENDINRYLHYTFEGQYNSSGCAFITYDADIGFHDLNTFVYGHNMRNGTMFGSLKLIYNDMDENLKEPYFYLWTKDRERIMYRVIALYVVDKDSQMYAIPENDAGYKEYLADVLAKGSIASRIPFTDEEQAAMDACKPIVTLSACYGPAGTRNRLLVQGVEILRESF